ncbi:MAG: hypothetical protein ACUVQQ_11725 [Thermogutta sp.]
MPSETLQEFTAWPETPPRVDVEAGVIYGVKVLGFHSKNGREYPAETLRRAVPLYENARVNINHPSRPGEPRDYRDRLGEICRVRFREGSGLFADLRFNPKHELAQRLVWDAEHAPRNLGLSHNVLAQVRREGGRTVVEEIERVLSVDVVADPAGTQGLFESQAPGVTGATGAREEIRGETAEDSALVAGAADKTGKPPASPPSPSLQEALAKTRRELARLQRACRLAEAAGEYGLLPPHAPQRAVGPRLGKHLWDLLVATEDARLAREILREAAALARAVPGGGRPAAPLGMQGEPPMEPPSARDPLRRPPSDATAEFVRAVLRP